MIRAEVRAGLLAALLLVAPPPAQAVRPAASATASAKARRLILAFEEAAHAAFIAALGPNALWLKIA